MEHCVIENLPSPLFAKEGSLIRKKLLKVLREPLVHFLAIGAGLFLLSGLVGDRAVPPSNRIVVTPAQVQHLAVGFTRVWQRPPTQRELDGLIEDYIREEVYYREALAMGLDRDDTIIRRRLRQKMEFLTEDLVESKSPSDVELTAFLQKNPDAFRLEPRLAFRHVYLNRNRRGKSADADARLILAQLTSGANPDTLGDSFLLEHDVRLSTRSEIARLFGETFAEQLLRVKPGRWAGPIESGYGLHLVFVRERAEGRLPELAEVREAVQREWLGARRKELTEATYGRLRERYTVVVERAKPVSGAAEAQ
jgi:hypothetical protein